jgi:hypothetical protein
LLLLLFSSFQQVPLLSSPLLRRRAAVAHVFGCARAHKERKSALAAAAAAAIDAVIVDDRSRKSYSIIKTFAFFCGEIVLGGSFLLCLDDSLLINA